jgi:vacuolar protein sorting-associated protein 8
MIGKASRSTATVVIRCMSSTQNLWPPSPSFSDDDDEQHEDTTLGDYSARMEEVLSDDDHDDNNDKAKPANGFGDEDSDEDSEVFVYDGVDAPGSAKMEDMNAYKSKLRDILGQDADSDEDVDVDVNPSAESEREVERSLVVEPQDVPTDSVSSEMSSPSRTSSPLTLQDLTPSKLIARPFLHPNVSRLRSYTPQHSNSLMASTSSIGSGTGFGVGSPSPSHFSAVSRMSSVSNLRDLASTGSLSESGHGLNGNDHSSREKPREPFKWTPLRTISNQLFSAAASKAASVLGAPTLGTPTVLAANGLICVGTEEGKICVYDFKQTLKCVCGNDSTGEYTVLLIHPVKL